MTGTKESDDPHEILNCDPASVAIRASKSYDTLQKLKAFAQQLTKYVGLMEDALVVDLLQIDDDDDDDGDHVENPPSTVARRPPAMVPRRRVRKRTSATDSPTSESNNNKIGLGEKRKASWTASNRQDGIHLKNELAEIPRKSQPPANPTTDLLQVAARSVRALDVDLLQVDDDDHDADHAATPPSAVVRRPPAMVPRRRVRKRTGATYSPTSESNNNKIGLGEKRKASWTASNREDGMHLKNEPTEMPRKSQPPANPTTISPQVAARCVRARTQVATATPSPSPSRRFYVEEEESDEDENDDNADDYNDKDYQPREGLVCETIASNDAIRHPPEMMARGIAAAKPSPKIKRPSLSTEEVKKKSGEELSMKGAIEPDMSHRCPKMLAPGVKADLKRSLLERSVGRTRKVLNEHSEYLGLTAKFNVPVVSKHGSRVSHLTLKSTLNDLPQSRNETLEWWLGEGSNRMALASPLDPSVQEQPPEGVPVFWATPNSGADICHYVGHFRCIAFFKTRHVLMLEHPRQALIELKFVNFDESLAQKIASI